MRNKKIILIIFAILILVLISFFTYIFIKNGNNKINKSEEDIINNILNTKEYEAVLNIEVHTNKNTTKYKVKQEVKSNKSIQEVIEPQNIAGIRTEYDGTNLKIINNTLNLTTTFENYSYIVENRLWLDSFIEDYKKYSNSKTSSNKDEIILEVRNRDNNKYNVYKKLYIDKKNNKPTKMIVQDVNQKNLVNILYSEIKIF